MESLHDKPVLFMLLEIPFFDMAQFALAIHMCFPPHGFVVCNSMGNNWSLENTGRVVGVVWS